MSKKIIIRRFAVYTGLFSFGLAVFLFMLFSYLHFSTNSAALYFLKDTSGLRLATDITFNEADSLVFRIDATGLFNRLFDTVAAATDSPVINTGYDPSRGKGVLKQFRPDGSRLEISLSRFDDDEASPAGLIIGGDFPPGDSAMHREGGGMAFYDGSRWIHIWCTANEGIGVSKGGPVYEPHKWRYLSGRIIKKDVREAIIESVHEVSLLGEPVRVTRRLRSGARDDFITLMIRITNTGKRPVLYDYAYGDEPWVGAYGSSEGDIGWYEDGFITRETYIDPRKYSIIGYADLGNREAGEYGQYSGYANFIQWIDTTPSMVYFSNDFSTVSNRVLDSTDNRILNIVWKDQYLLPGEAKTYVLRIGFIGRENDVFETGGMLTRVKNTVSAETVKKSG